jgi:hypothetical protein
MMEQAFSLDLRERDVAAMTDGESRRAEASTLPHRNPRRGGFRPS